MVDWSRTYDVLVVGGGNAGLSAAICAAEAGASVLLLEGAPRAYRGGNTRHTRNLRVCHDEPTDVLTEAYPEDEYWDDLLKVTGGKTTEHLARMTIRGSLDAVGFMKRNGVAFQPALAGTLQLGRTNAFFMGGGKAVVNALFRAAEALGVEVMYEAEVTGLDIADGHFTGATVTLKRDGETTGTRHVAARTLVAAAGGFESNIEWLKEYWGEAVENFRIRGTPYNMGGMLRALLDKGAAQIGEPDQCHAVAIDGRAPKFDGGIVTRVDCVSLGIVVNENGMRFYDEGEDFWPKRYAIWGRLVAKQPDQVGHVIIDQKPVGHFMPPVFPPVEADSIRGLAEKLGLDADTLEKTVADYNAAVVPGTFDNTVLDDCRTEGLEPPKTHWARTIDQPPYYAYSLRPGITFTYLGVKVDENARMLMADGKPSANIFACGEIMAGNVMGQGYLGGLGMAVGSVFGQIAGREAARHGRN